MKKGFTLIELLAVIVILAIIALIATPIILGIIDDAKESSAEVSAKNYLDAVGLAITASDLKSIIVEDGVYKVQSDGSLCPVSSEECNDKNKIIVEVSGEVPSTQSQVVIQNNKVVPYIINEYNVKVYTKIYIQSNLIIYDIEKGDYGIGEEMKVFISSSPDSLSTSDVVPTYLAIGTNPTGQPVKIFNEDDLIISNIKATFTNSNGGLQYVVYLRNEGNTDVVLRSIQSDKVPGTNIRKVCSDPYNISQSVLNNACEDIEFYVHDGQTTHDLTQAENAFSTNSSYLVYIPKGETKSIAIQIVYRTTEYVGSGSFTATFGNIIFDVVPVNYITN